jgi:hypothetical protein
MGKIRLRVPTKPAISQAHRAKEVVGKRFFDEQKILRPIVPS